MLVTSALLALLQLAAAAPVDSNALVEFGAAENAGPDAQYAEATSSGSALLSDETVAKILANGVTVSEKSWEFGTLYESYLELYDEHLTPFAWNPKSATSPPRLLTDSLQGKNPFEQLQSYRFPDEVQWSKSPINSFLSKNPSPALENKALIWGDGSLGDPAALGTATWLLAVLGEKSNAPHSPQAYAWAAANQLNHLHGGRGVHGGDENTAISHREDHWELWADQGYMIPPFLAFVGLASGDAGLLGEALKQWMLVSNELLVNNLYRHATADAEWAKALWATGNGWMLAGLTRVLASINTAGVADQFSAEINAAKDTAVNVFRAVFAQLVNEDNGGARVPNNMRDAGDNALDSAGTAAVVAAFYRFHAMYPEAAQSMATDADRAYKGVIGQLDGDGWLQACVDPSGGNGFRMAPDVKSAEGQTFVVLMHAARRAAKI